MNDNTLSTTINKQTNKPSPLTCSTEVCQTSHKIVVTRLMRGMHLYLAICPKAPLLQGGTSQLFSTHLLKCIWYFPSTGANTLPYPKQWQDQCWQHNLLTGRHGGGGIQTEIDFSLLSKFLLIFGIKCNYLLFHFLLHKLYSIGVYLFFINTFD